MHQPKTDRGGLKRNPHLIAPSDTASGVLTEDSSASEVGQKISVAVLEPMDRAQFVKADDLTRSTDNLPVLLSTPTALSLSLSSSTTDGQATAIAKIQTPSAGEFNGFTIVISSKCPIGSPREDHTVTMYWAATMDQFPITRTEDAAASPLSSRSSQYSITFGDSMSSTISSFVTQSGRPAATGNSPPQMAHAVPLLWTVSPPPGRCSPSLNFPIWMKPTVTDNRASHWANLRHHGVSSIDNGQNWMPDWNKPHSDCHEKAQAYRWSMGSSPRKGSIPKRKCRPWSFRGHGRSDDGVVGRSLSVGAASGCGAQIGSGFHLSDEIDG
ncbi:hypothetical protein PDE_06973 [Penicillium oxalicum 114-2]|uniref:Uncharacterized protein n=1 Tax=Penicillium oxalicum (strain 114-2 / CGMCC 5302) TaxID=933388 RepID=S7ZNR6_PENO1|nr:hypothetical protein PDE_06973 [Penicillium oxalicum 114-2]